MITLMLVRAAERKAVLWWEGCDYAADPVDWWRLVMEQSLKWEKAMVSVGALDAAQTFTDVAMLALFRMLHHLDELRGDPGKEKPALVDRSGAPMQLGAIVEDFRGVEWLLRGFTPPRRVGSTGRVLLEDSSGYQREFYPGVIGARITQ